MTISTFAELKTSVSNWLHRADLAAVSEDFIMLAEFNFNRRLRVSGMEESLNVTISSGVAALPADYVGLKYAYIDGLCAQKLDRKTAEWIISNYPNRSAQDKPLTIARDGENFIFGPYPNSDYTVKGTYYKRLAPLSGSNTTNWFMVNAPDLLLYGSLLEAAPYLKGDIRIPVWQSKFEMALGAVQGEADREELSGGPIVATVR